MKNVPFFLLGSLLCFSIFPVNFVEAGIEIVGPSKSNFVGFKSESCVAFTVSLQGMKNDYNAVNGTKLIEWVRVEKDYCEPKENGLKYKGMAVNMLDLSPCVHYGDPAGVRMKHLYELAKQNQIAALLYVWDVANAYYAVPGSSAFLVDQLYGDVPFLVCEMMNDKSGKRLEPGYMRKSFFPEETKFVTVDGMITTNSSQSLLINLTIDDNPWTDTLKSTEYQIFFRGLMPVLYFAVAYFALNTGLIQRKRKKHLPFLLCTIETVSLFVLGLHFILGGWASNEQ